MFGLNLQGRKGKYRVMPERISKSDSELSSELNNIKDEYDYIIWLENKLMLFITITLIMITIILWMILK